MAASTTSPAELEQCAHACHECQDVCLALIPHCLTMGGEHASVDHINTLIDCVAMCGTAHGVLHRQSAMHVHTCRACAEICRTCARDCERIARGDRRMLLCVEECNRCAERCERMAA